MKKYFYLITCGLFDPAKNAGSLIGSLRYDLRRLARNPFGGSFVIFIPLCRTETGKTGDG